jgi:hypothetical protein
LPQVRSPRALANAESPPQIHVARRSVSGKAPPAGISAANSRPQKDVEIGEYETAVTMQND